MSEVLQAYQTFSVPVVLSRLECEDVNIITRRHCHLIFDFSIKAITYYSHGNEQYPPALVRSLPSYSRRRLSDAVDSLFSEEETPTECAMFSP